MSEQEDELRNRHQLELAEAIAKGVSINKWAKLHGIPPRTAYNWADRREVRSQVDAIRRRAVDKAVGKMTRRLDWATNRIIKLGNDASSEAVQLSAAKTFYTNVVCLNKYSVLDHRVAALEEEFLDHDGNKD
jgi:hypothetical protein